MITNSPLTSVYQQFIHQTRYARYLDAENRRETWDETVGRYTDFMEANLLKSGINASMVEGMGKEIFDAIHNLDVMPSMRAMMTAGPALARDNIAGFNCSYIPINHPRAFDEMVYILMCGSGVGFSVERQEITQLPEVPSMLNEVEDTIIVEDSKAGWATSVREQIEALYKGKIRPLNTTLVRGPGERLKTFGGRASGPAPLIKLHKFLVETFKTAAGRKLTSIECHDICCMIGDIVVSGGVRRSALISLSNLSDQRMRDAKSGEWWEYTEYRRLANNSVAYTEKPPVGQWMQEWSSIYESKSGERGIFNREAVYHQCKKHGRLTRLLGETSLISFGVNPCGEIILRPNQFCNLTEIVARVYDTVETLLRKVRIATIIGTYQSSLTNFQYIRPIWKENSEEERLLGVSFTGIMDCPLLNGIGTSRVERNTLLKKLRLEAERVNMEIADLLNINNAAAITCVKPSGTVSQLTNSSSGIHRRFAAQYIRTARNDVKDPITEFIIANGIPAELDKFEPDNMVFSFPIHSPAGSVTRNDGTAIEELENWLDFKTHWCHHNPSVTINVREDEWPGVGAWVYDHFDEVAGVSFLPHKDHIYEQAPYQDADSDEIRELDMKMPNYINWTLNVEVSDKTTGTQELACSSGMCEI